MLSCVDVIYLTNFPRGMVEDVAEFVSAHLGEGRRVWCRIPDSFDVHVRKVSFGLDGVVLKKQYLPVLGNYVYLTVSDDVIREVLHRGKGVISTSNLIASLDENRRLCEADLLKLSLARLKEHFSPRTKSVREFQAVSARVRREEEKFVFAYKSNTRDQTAYQKITEQPFFIKASDLFVQSKDYQLYLSGAVAQEKSAVIEEWMPESLIILNEFSVKYKKMKEASSDGKILPEQLEELRLMLADRLGVKNTKGNTVNAAVKVISLDEFSYPGEPLKWLSKENKISLLDIANEMAKFYWKGSVEETRAQYVGSLDKFRDDVFKILRNHNVKEAVLREELLRFIRFWRR